MKTFDQWMREQTPIKKTWVDLCDADIAEALLDYNDPTTPENHLVYPCCRCEDLCDINCDAADFDPEYSILPTMIA